MAEAEEAAEPLKRILLLLCGVPGAGKTTFVKDLKSNPPEILKDFDIRHIDFDDVYFGIADEFSSESWHESRVKCHEQTSGIMQSKQERPLLIILDDNFYYRSMRFEYFKLARRFQFSFLTLRFTIEIEEAISRDSKRPAPVGEEIIRKMFGRIEFPDPERYRWDRFLDSPDWSTILPEPPVPPLEEVDPAVLEESRKKTASSVKHQVDLGLRKRVGETMRVLKKKDWINMKVASKKINQVKSKILKSTAKGIIESAEDIEMEVEKQIVAFQIEIDRLFPS